MSDNSKTQHINLEIEGMTCNNCALGIKRVLEKKGAANVDVSFANAEVNFEMTDNTLLTYDELINSIEGLGFKVVADQENEEDVEQSKALVNWSDLEWKLFIAAIFTIPLFFAMFLPFAWLHSPTVQLLLCLPVFVIGVAHFGTSAIKSLRAGVPNMDVLIILGSSAAFLYSLIGYAFGLGPNFMFWETAATIITLVLTGNLMEQRSVRQTSSAIRELGKLQPSTAQRIVKSSFNTSNEQLETVHYKKIKVGDYLLVNTGERIPTDGKLLWGEAYVNEAMMTGESEAVKKQLNSPLIGGTIVESGSLKMQATKTGDKTALAQIIKLVKDAQANNPPIQQLADKISAIFVPVVIGIATITFLLAYFVFGVSFQQAMLNSIAVLVISCPCAMGLATPTAVMVGLGRAAKSGILIKSGTILEKLANIKQIVFDKTGTLTQGNFSIAHYHSDLKEATFKAVIVGLEKHSTHPIAKAIVNAWGSTTIPFIFSDVQEEKGVGIIGTTPQGDTYRVGSYRIAQHLSTDSSHQVYVLKNDVLVGWLDLEDSLRPDAKGAVAQLQANQLKPVLLSGDKTSKTQQVAQQLGIDTYFAEQMPAQKLEKIAALSAQGATAMVGDGINDAPALAKADVGIALSNASQVAIESADVVLINSQLKNISSALLVSKHTVITIKQNLFWAFFYNVLAIPLAAMGFLSPMIAALTMAFSDVIVIGNSIRLKYKKLV